MSGGDSGDGRAMDNRVLPMMRDAITTVQMVLFQTLRQSLRERQAELAAQQARMARLEASIERLEAGAPPLQPGAIPWLILAAALAAGLIWGLRRVAARG